MACRPGTLQRPRLTQTPAHIQGKVHTGTSRNKNSIRRKEAERWEDCLQKYLTIGARKKGVF